MRLFIATEAQLPAATIISEINRKINKNIGIIEITDYTNVLDNLGIIINCFDKEWLGMGFGKERRYINYKNKYADIRLNIPLEKFMSASNDEKYFLILQNILDSILIIQSRINTSGKGTFDGDILINYILNKLNLQSEDLIIN